MTNFEIFYFKSHPDFQRGIKMQIPRTASEELDNFPKGRFSLRGGFLSSSSNDPIGVLSYFDFIKMSLGIG